MNAVGNKKAFILRPPIGPFGQADFFFSQRLAVSFG